MGWQVKLSPHYYQIYPHSNLWNLGMLLYMAKRRRGGTLWM